MRLTPEERERRERNKSRLCLIAGFLFIGSLMLYVLENTPLDNTIGGARVCWMGSLAGGVLGFLLMWYIARIIVPGLPNTLLTTLLMESMVTVALITVVVVSKINRYAANPKAEFAIYNVLEKAENDPLHFLFFSFKGSNQETSYERVDVEPAFYNAVAVGDKIRFTTRRGFFGFSVIDKIEKVQTGVNDKRKP